MVSTDEAYNIFLEFYSKLVCIDELYEAVHIKELAKDMAIIHIRITNAHNANELIHHIKEIK